jgi:Mlc titration factor MtfA (ptsG expression regulator)
MRVVIAAQACLPILNLAPRLLSRLVPVIVYPESFVAIPRSRGRNGVVHTGYEELDGESAEGGPSCSPGMRQNRNHPMRPTTSPHEFAHKLDEFNRGANGLPPLHADISVKRGRR